MIEAFNRNVSKTVSSYLLQLGTAAIYLFIAAALNNNHFHITRELITCFFPQLWKTTILVVKLKLYQAGATISKKETVLLTFLLNASINRQHDNMTYNIYPVMFC